MHLPKKTTTIVTQIPPPEVARGVDSVELGRGVAPTLLSNDLQAR